MKFACFFELSVNVATRKFIMTSVALALFLRTALPERFCCARAQGFHLGSQAGSDSSNLQASPLVMMMSPGRKGLGFSFCPQ